MSSHHAVAVSLKYKDYVMMQHYVYNTNCRAMYFIATEEVEVMENCKLFIYPCIYRCFDTTVLHMFLK